MEGLAKNENNNNRRFGDPCTNHYKDIFKKEKKKKRERSELYGKIKRFYKPYGDFMSVFVSFLAETVDLWLLE